MKIAIILGFVTFAKYTVSSININEIDKEEWNLFKMKYNTFYEDIDEEAYRKNIYLDNKLMIVSYNKLYESGKETYELELNQFGDLMYHEYANNENRFKRNLVDRSKNYIDYDAVTSLKFENVVIPESLEWRTKGYVTPVKNQEQCGSC